MRAVLEDFPGTLGEDEIGELENTKNPRGMKIGNNALIRKVSEGRHIGQHSRYWKYRFAGRWYVCSEWWKSDHRHNAGKLSAWVRLLIEGAQDPKARNRLQNIRNRLSVWGEQSETAKKYC